MREDEIFLLLFLVLFVFSFNGKHYDEKKVSLILHIFCITPVGVQNNNFIFIYMLVLQTT